MERPLKKIVLVSRPISDIPGTPMSFSPISGMSAIRQSLLKSEKIEYKVDILNIYEFSTLKEYIIGNKPDFIGFSVYSWNFLFLISIIENLEKDYPDIPCFIGGPSSVEFLYRSLPNNILFACVGEGELTSRDSLDEYFLRGKILDKDGIITRTQVFTKPVVYRDFNKDSENYFYEELKDCENVKFLTWELSRGCPFGCKFCMWSVPDNKKVRSISFERFKKDIELIIQKHPEEVFISDATSNVNPIEFKKRLRYIIDNVPKDISFCFEMRAELIDEEMAFLLSKFKCRIDIGLQSLDPGVLRKINRPLNKERFFKGISYLNSYPSIEYWVDLILFLPGETKESFISGIDESILGGIKTLFINILQLFPGNSLYEIRDTFIKDTFKTAGGLCIVKETNSISKEDIRDISHFIFSISKITNTQEKVKNLDLDNLQYTVGENNLYNLDKLKNLSEKMKLRPSEIIKKICK